MTRTTAPAERTSTGAVLTPVMVEMQRRHMAAQRPSTNLRRPACYTLCEGTGLDLVSAATALEEAAGGRSLSHLTSARIGLLVRSRSTRSGWWNQLFSEAMFADTPWLTMVPGHWEEQVGFGSVYFWARPEPPRGWVASLPRPRRSANLKHDVEIRSPYAGDGKLPGVVAGPDVSFEICGAMLRCCVEEDAFWGEHIEIVRDAEDALTCRFELSDGCTSTTPSR